ncbi:hypothetical protein EST38_g3511 [Candolleomyces aberdarensis]|uniref:Ubiquitin thioesterase OTU n=1 Tax=Candolleomyces aberdarensis TaxID=2316362 RepID=A0A4Q2DQB6_9AGAR|nr:hypothetical protein EST38_g3511 [Candolleomyces aberdarensis]
MAPVRLRHPKGVSTIQIPLDQEDYTVQDLLQEIYKATEILPSRQSLKTGYPPRPLTLVPELPLSSLDLKSGEQLIVQEDAPSSSRGTESAAAATSSARAVARSPPRSATRPAAPPAPAPASREPAQSSSSKKEFVEVDGGYLVHRVVPDDNSCLFSSLALIFEQSMTKAQQLRKTVAEGIKGDPITYDEGILGMPPPKYIETISKPSSWGGAIELAILASHYHTEIASIDVETGRIDKFSPNENSGPASGNRALVVYSGIHYDALSFSPMEEAPDEWHQTLFPIKDGSDESDSILVAAKKLADSLRAKKAFTNTATFDLRCEQCGQGLKGEKGARAHAEATGHTRFGEY